MKTKALSTVVMTLALGALIATTAVAQHEGHSSTKDTGHSATQGEKAMSHGHMMMANEPHHILAMAYHQNLGAFAKVLHEQTTRAKVVNVEFARAAVTEMRRSFNQMNQHHQGHMVTMSAEMQTRMSGMMQEMATHQAELNKQLGALEQEVQLATPDAKNVATLAASVHKHLDMSKMKHDNKGSKMGKKV